MSTEPLPAKVPFHEQAIPGSQITLCVCQGIGDILWVYQKFAPYFDRIKFKVLSPNGTESAQRAIPWLETLPKFAGAQFWVDWPDRYTKLAKRPCTMRDAFNTWQWGKEAAEVEYSCNVWLENGVRLDDIDPGSKLDTSIDFKTAGITFPQEPYIVLYVSGDTRHDSLKVSPSHRLWTADAWGEYVDLLRKKYPQIRHLPVVMIGAKFDAEILGPMYVALESRGIYCTHMFGSSPGEIITLLKHAELFIGYQSGLNVVADLLGVRQVMIYFVYLDSMRYTWCNKTHIRKKFFASTFDRSPEYVVNEHDLFPVM